MDLSTIAGAHAALDEHGDEAIRALGWSWQLRSQAEFPALLARCVREARTASTKLDLLSYHMRSLLPESFVVLSVDRSVQVRRLIASHPVLPMEAVLNLSQDEDETVLSTLLHTRKARNVHAGEMAEYVGYLANQQWRALSDAQRKDLLLGDVLLSRLYATDSMREGLGYDVREALYSGANNVD